MSADDGSSWSDVTSPASQPKRGQGLASTKAEWESEEASEDVINNLLRVKKLSQRVSSVESDGLPSMASVDVEDNVSVMSESSDLQRARKMYAELQAMSLESASGSTEVLISISVIFHQIYSFICRIFKILTPTPETFITRYELCPSTPAGALRTFWTTSGPAARVSPRSSLRRKEMSVTDFK